MQSIEIDEELFAYLQSKAIPFVETPNLTLRRLLLGDSVKPKEAKHLVPRSATPSKIVNLISENSRISTTALAKELDTTSTVIQYRLKKLHETKIIIGYTININFPKFGYYWFKADVELNKFGEINKIINYIEENPSLVYILGTIGFADLELTFILKNTHQLSQIMEDLSRKFPDTIKNYTYTYALKSYKAYGI